MRMTKKEVIAALEAMCEEPAAIEVVSEVRSEENQATIYVFNFNCDETSVCVVYDNEDVIFTPCDWQSMQSGFTDGLEALKVLADDNWLSYHVGLNLRRKAVVLNGFPKIFVQ